MSLTISLHLLFFCCTGKSTIAALLERFYDVTKGSVTIDNVNINELDPSKLRGQTIGFINQVSCLICSNLTSLLLFVPFLEQIGQPLFKTIHQGRFCNVALL